MLEGAMAELGVGNPDRLSVDVGPVITEEAQERLLDHIDRMRAAGHAVHQAALPEETRRGTLVPPTIIENAAGSDLPGGGFGPGPHLPPYPRADLEAGGPAGEETRCSLT